MENNMKILWYFSLISAILMAIGGITEYKCVVTTFLSFILCFIQLSNENSISQIIKKYCPFIFTYIGRGIFLLFFGCIILTSYIALIINSSIFGWAPEFSEITV
ncbi:hypothetical protein H8356DRAFT_964647 [Neocallimastix lanati (nom. inval.)]|uniref:Uncharacterized protein n=1 Tax=Neocallimastix californiae TaxID=1754190 RepID=A0A1Y1ZHC4_9FUNG|nr:hypothetical protein H8356DRAFT_964647 [Neocallimastix sp. JGI-2020a]ORY09407.1 hypothetical protein LY90DRAFT_518880 [Neocallimastix californiae]|eukprot:ORY09407.1 hypothetical protein LY90DRAFT_518880 [Neocallimastix californiae]